MRNSFLAGNWKMHKTQKEAEELAGKLVTSLRDCRNRIMIAPSFTALSGVSRILKDSNILLGAQNMSTDESGAHTGEVSVLMLKDIGVSIVILGHSERRHVYNETDEVVNKKLKLALGHGLEVILCVGETLEEREGGRALSVVRGQLTEGLKDVSSSLLENVVIAYEPVWAIGTGKTATPEDADEIHRAIRKEVSSLYGTDAADRIIIQYGGSVKPDNVKDLMAMDNIDGALVGGASLKSETFIPIAEYNK